MREPNRNHIRKLREEEIAGALWTRLSYASKRTGLSEYRIRQTNVSMRRVGNADFVDPRALNTWIDGLSRDDQSPEMGPSI